MEKKEYCVLCGKITRVMQDCPVSERDYYLEGAGQLCGECYREIYAPVHNGGVEQINNLLWTGDGGKQWRA